MVGDLRRFDPRSSSPLRALANQPNVANMYRLDQLVAAMTNHRALKPAEAGIMAMVGVAILGLVAIGIL